jgi:heat-inducible transcriptional repressor
VLTPRQETLLGKVVETFAESGQPVGSKALAADPEIDAKPSTIRYELSVLEEHGLLAHPHTSAGRIPTDSGHRFYVDNILPRRTSRAVEQPLGLQLAEREVSEAMRVTSETLSQVTNLLAIVSAPPVNTATVRHIEVLLLQPQVLMVVVITSAGGVTKRIVTFDRPIDPGLADWSREYLNEQLVGLGLGSRILQSRLADPGLRPTERRFLDRLAPAFRELSATAEDTLYIEGAARLLSAYRFSDESELNVLLEMLERRVSLLGVLSKALSSRELYVRIGRELEAPGLRSLALVAANYGLPQRNLGTVSVIGPTHMDYDHAIRSVREAAGQLSRFIVDLYEDH